MGDRPAELAAAIASIAEAAPGVSVLVVANGADIGSVPGADVLSLAENLGVPGDLQPHRPFVRYAPMTALLVVALCGGPVPGHEEVPATPVTTP